MTARMATQHRSTTTRRTRPSVRESSSLPKSLAATAYSSETGRTYRLDSLIGKGGFGEVYLATPIPGDGYPA